MPTDPPMPETARQQGCRMACEGILRSRFGQRSSDAVSKAMETLRKGDGRIIPFINVEFSPSRFTRAALALAAGIAVLLTLGVWFFGPTMGDPVLAEIRGTGTLIERRAEPLPTYKGIRLRASDVLRTGSNAI